MQSYPVHELLGHVKLPDQVVERPLHGISQLAARDVRVRAEIKLELFSPANTSSTTPYLAPTAVFMFSLCLPSSTR